MYALSACVGSTTPKQGAGLIDLAMKKHELRCELGQLTDSVNLLWDEVADYLDEELPDHMPADERRNMLNVRNANLIAMFMAFDTLPMTLKDKVMSAGKVDEDIAQSMREIMSDYQVIERQLFDSLAAWQSKDNFTYLRLKDELQRLENVHCP